MAATPEARDGLRDQHRLRAAWGANAAAAVALALLLTVMINYLSARHYVRRDWTRHAQYALSDKTRQMLAGVSNRVDVILFVRREYEAYADLDALLREYQAASPRIQVERVDPVRQLARAEQLAARYKVQDENVVIVELAGRTRVVSARDTVEMDYSPALQGGSPRRVAFRGEQVLSSAIQSLRQERTPVVYFLSGHGERDPAEHDPAEGYSGVARLMMRDTIEVRPLLLAGRHAVPDDASAVVIPGPDKRLSAGEVDLLRAYLDRSGRVLVMLDTRSAAGLEGWLVEWGVQLAVDVVIDPSRTISGLDLFTDRYEPHPITRPLHHAATVFYLPRSVEPAVASARSADSADKPVAIPLIRTSPEGWAEVDSQQKPLRFDSGRDRKGPISVAVAVERGPVSALQVDVRPSRLVVIGDTDFVANQSVGVGANADFFLSAVNWLLERADLMAISPKPPVDERLLLNAHQLSLLLAAVVGGLPGLAALAGLAVWWARRR